MSNSDRTGTFRPVQLQSSPTMSSQREEPVPKTVEVSLGIMSSLIHIEKCKLRVMDGALAGQELVVDKPIVRIGANQRNDLVLSDDTVSRFHCEIRRVQDGYLLVDRQSTNGTFVGQLQVREALLYPNCEVTIGSTTVGFMPLVEELQVYPIDDHRYGDMVGASDRMKEVYGLIDKIAPSELSL